MKMDVKTVRDSSLFFRKYCPDFKKWCIWFAVCIRPALLSTCWFLVCLFLCNSKCCQYNFRSVKTLSHCNPVTTQSRFHWDKQIASSELFCSISYKPCVLLWCFIYPFQYFKYFSGFFTSVTRRVQTAFQDSGDIPRGKKIKTFLSSWILLYCSQSQGQC